MQDPASRCRSLRGSARAAFLSLGVLEHATLLLMIWTGFIYVVLLTLHFSHHMLAHQLLVLVVFGPGAMLLAGWIIAEAMVHRRR